MSKNLVGYGHVAARLGNHIVVFGGRISGLFPMSTHWIMMYNIYTGQWREHIIPEKKDAPHPFTDAVAVGIGPQIYLFGGWVLRPYKETNQLWELTERKGCYNWRRIYFSDDVKVPSPRRYHSGWGYAECLWIFGGSVGSSGTQRNFLHEHGAFAYSMTNQLLCYNPSTQIWTNPQCLGAVPSPRSQHSSAIIKDKVWLFGGIDEDYSKLDDFFQLDMESYTWTSIRTSQIAPGKCRGASLSAISETQLVLHGNISSYNVIETWIIDLPSYTWKQHSSKENHRGCYYAHTSSSELNRSLTIIFCKTQNFQEHPFKHRLVLESKSLQQLAMQVIYNHRRELPWEDLPSNLIAQLGLSENENM